MTTLRTSQRPGRAPSRRQQRSLQRAIHLVAGMALLAQLYGSSVLGAGFTAAVQWVVVPVVVATGVVMWQGPRIRRWLRGSGSPRA
jgi:hypothetical protein